MASGAQSQASDTQPQNVANNHANDPIGKDMDADAEAEGDNTTDMDPDLNPNPNHAGTMQEPMSDMDDDADNQGQSL